MVILLVIILCHTVKETVSISLCLEILLILLGKAINNLFKISNKLNLLSKNLLKKIKTFNLNLN